MGQKFFRKDFGLLVAFACLLLLPFLNFSTDILRAAPVADEQCQFFPQTNHKVCGEFLSYWLSNGGLTQQGYPITDVFEQRNQPPPFGDGQLHVVQYFQRARFEQHRENQPPYNVLLGLLGQEQFKGGNQQDLPLNPIPGRNCQLFLQTHFKVCGRFLEYWVANGGLAQQGYPISDVLEEQNPPPPAGDAKIHQVQYFQRARFEEHLENQAPYDVLLGLLGQEQYKSKYPTGQ